MLKLLGKAISKFKYLIAPDFITILEQSDGTAENQAVCYKIWVTQGDASGFFIIFASCLYVRKRTAQELRQS